MVRKTFALCVAAVLTCSAARADNCDPLQYTLTNGTLADATQVMENFTHLLDCINALVPSGGSGVRQAVTSGPMTTAGLPDFLPATSATLSVTSVKLSATTPLTVTAANGIDPATGRQRDLVGRSTTNLIWNGLTASSNNNYLYVKVETNGTLTTGTTIREPIYQAGGTPSIQNGQFTFNIGEMKGYLGNGSLAEPSTIVFIGAAATGPSSVTGTTPYAYNGLFEGIPAAPLIVSNWVPSLHNIGIKPDFYDFIIVNVASEHGYEVGDTLHAASLIGNYGSFTLPLALTANTGGLTFFAAPNYVTSNKGSASSVTLTPAKWQYRFIARRGW